MGGWAAIGLAAARPVAADNFRVENAVFAENQQQPESRTITIFAGGLVYDFLDQPPEAIVLDQAAGRFTLLDLQRRVRTVLSTEEVAAFSEKLKQRAAQYKDDALLTFMAEPAFQEQFDSKTNRLTLASPEITYQLQLTPFGNGSAALQYRDFSDWYIRLNVLLNPGSRPPQARMALNEAVARHRAVAREVQLTIASKTGAGSKPSTMRSTHAFAAQLTAADQERVKKAGLHDQFHVRRLPAVSSAGGRKMRNAFAKIGCHCWLAQQCSAAVSLMHCWTSQQWHPYGWIMNGMNT